MKLVTIGDSISQGFMSAAAARTDLCYSTLLARCLGLTPGQDYLFPNWPLGGHPVNLELLLRRLQQYYGSNIFGPFEWTGALVTIMNFFDKVEDYYERGEGASDRTHPTFGHPTGVSPRPYFDNLAVRGFNVSDAWQMTSQIAKGQIGDDNEDNVFGLPKNSFDRTAYAVLNPTRDPDLDSFSAIDLLQRHAAGESGDDEGVENLVLWLGANNALGTVLDLNIKSSAEAIDYDNLDQIARRAFNLWTPEHFHADYGILLDKVVTAMTDNKNPDWRVFVGTVPAVTIAPLAKGVGSEQIRPDPFGVIADGATYFEFYTYVPLDLKAARSGEKLRLERDEAYFIDQTIHHFNQSIGNLVAQANASLDKERVFIVDINKALLQLAFKRNRGKPTYPLPPEVANLLPRPDTRYYDVTRGGKQLVGGGLLSLDGVHPGAIGHGLLAFEFKKAMQANGVTFPFPLDWPAIIASDDLYKKPINLIREIYDNTRLWHIILSCLRA